MLIACRRRSVPAPAAGVLLVAFGACARSVSTPPAPAPEPTTLLTRLGVDTLALEQYTRTPTRMEGVVVQHVPFTTVGRYTVELGANAVPLRATYSVRRADGTPLPNAPQSLDVRFDGDSVRLVAHRATGDTTKTIAARGERVPFASGSYALYELAIARLLASGRDSGEFRLLPLSFAVQAASSLPVALVGRDTARFTWFGRPLYAAHQGGHVTGFDGRETTVKVRVERVAAADLSAVNARWGASERSGAPVGAASTRDTARATLGEAHIWVDYGRPALRGRDVWARGVLGDTIWRTGANAATQLGTDHELDIGGTVVPAGTYSLFTHATPAGYRLIINRQSGQWGTEYHSDRDLARVPLSVSTVHDPVERFTIALEPRDARAGVLSLTWGTRRLSVPVSVR